jgi:hypothetical protein
LVLDVFLVVMLFVEGVSRVAHIGVAMSLHFAPGDERFGGSLLLVVLYVVAGLLVASPLGRSRMRAAT